MWGVQVMRVPEGLRLYRGTGGKMELPESLYRADRHGCRGYMEYGFMSTTASREIALQYSGAKEGRPLAMVLETACDGVNRGACIADFSQYPGTTHNSQPDNDFLPRRHPPLG